MSRNMSFTGLVATGVIALILALYAALEPSRLEAAQAQQRAEDLYVATDLYAQNCVMCHGTLGAGIAAIPALNHEGLRGLDSETLANTIARGRYNTAMAAWSTEEGGLLTDMQIDRLVTLIQYGDWSQVGLRVAELGLTPPTAVQVEVTEDLLVQVRLLPGGDALSRGLTLYAEGCVACHNANGEGTAIAPALNSAELRARMADEDLARTITDGVPGTLMAGWGGTLDAAQVADLTQIIRRWEEIQAAGIELPAVEIATIPPTPEMIAAGQQLFSVACTGCHGRSAQGTRMAPALYNQTFLSQTPDQAIYQIIANGVPGTAMPAWGGRLTDSDINALVAYLRSLESTAPVIVPANP